MENVFVEVLQEIMIERNLNQTQFADIIGVKPSQVSEWLSGKALPGYISLKKIAKNLDISADYLLGLED